MMDFWRNLQAYGVPNEKILDEESLGTSGRIKLPQSRSIPRPRKTTIILLLLDLLVIGLLLHIFNPLIDLLRRNEELFGSRVTTHPPNTPNPQYHTSSSHNIPRILHQTTANETIPYEWIESQQTCKNAYSDFEYKLWTDESARNFISNEYPWFVDTWDAYSFPIQRADALRYFVLYHFGGIYLDIDTRCNQSFPIHEIESDTLNHSALFKSTAPTGVTNDFMITSARHPVYAAAIAKLPIFHAMTRLWARWEPHCAIMISAGPMFLTFVIKDYLLEQPSLPSPEIGVINATELAPYIADLEGGTWHRSDAQVFMWIGDRPWTWFLMGAIGLAVGLSILHRVLTIIFYRVLHKVESGSCDLKLAKVS